MNDRKTEGDGEGEPKSRDKETISLKRQSDEEFNNSGETDHMRKWCTSIKSRGHLQTKIK